MIDRRVQSRVRPTQLIIHPCIAAIPVLLLLLPDTVVVVLLLWGRGGGGGGGLERLVHENGHGGCGCRWGGNGPLLLLLLLPAVGAG